MTWTEVARGIDGYVTDWSAMHVGACVATRVHREQSEAALDLRMACLERRRSELDAMLDVFEHADAETVAHAREAVDAMIDIKACADVDALGRRRAVPRDPTARERYTSVRTRIDRARALVEVARMRDARPLLEQLLADATTLAHADLEAEAQLLYGKVQSEQGAFPEAERALFRALVRAQASRADDLVALAAVDLAYVIGERQARSAEGLRWADFAAAAIQGEGGNDLLSARLLAIRGQILADDHKLAEAEKADRDALELLAHVKADEILHAEVFDALASIVALRGRYQEARPLFEKAVALRELHYGKLNPLTASSRTNLANVLSGLREYDAAEREYRAALEAQEQIFGPDGYDLSGVLSNYGQMLAEQGKLREAEPLLQRALTIREKHLGPDHPKLAYTLSTLGYLYIELHRYKQALDAFTRADQLVERTLGPMHPSHADPLTGLGNTWLDAGQAARAIPPLERALALLQTSDRDSLQRATTQALLATALYRSKRDTVRAHKLGTEARKVLLDAGEAENARLLAWLH
jgi:tetratricopeptide (TPR) repeat protein